MILPFCFSRRQADETVSQIAALSAQLDICCAELTEEIRMARARHDGLINHLRQQITNLEEKLEQWAIGNHSEFVGKQSIEFSQGTIGFRKSPPSIELIEGNDWKVVLQYMRKLRRKFGRYIRKKEEVDKRQMLADLRPETAKLKPNDLQRIGLRYFQAKPFFIEIKSEGASNG